MIVMGKFLIDKKLLAVSATGLIVISAFFFRDQVSHLFSFGLDSSPKVEELVIKESKTEQQPEDLIPEETSSNPKAFPAYSGRDPEEVRPVPEEVKLFSEEQKAKLYEQIRTHGKAVKENPEYLFGWIQLGVLKKNIGDFEGARDAWEYAGLIRPENVVSFANLGELYWRYLSDFLKSEKNFRIAIKNKPDDPTVYVSLSELYSYSYKEKADLADDVLMEGIAANPDDINLLKSLASLYQRTGDYKKAVEWWKKVLAKEPDNKDIAAMIKALEEKL